MWKFYVHFVFLLHCADSEQDMRLFTPTNSEKNIFKHIAKCIYIISDMKLTPIIAMDTEQVRNETQLSEEMFIEELINIFIENKLPIILIGKKVNNYLFEKDIVAQAISVKKYSMIPLIITYLNTCDNITNYNFEDINKNMKLLIIISHYSIDNCVKELEEIKFFVTKYDITFIILDIADVKNEMFTFIPRIDGETCTETVDTPTYVNACLNGVLGNDTVFPAKNPINLNKCPLRVGMATLYPFSLIENSQRLETFDHINETVGSDMEIIKIYADVFNGSLDLYFINRSEENAIGDYGFLKYVLDGSLDVCAGGFYRIYGDHVEYSGIYARQAILWLYYAERGERSWENLVTKVTGMYIFIIFYITYTTVWYAIRTFDRDKVSLRNTLLYGWGALVGANSLEDARSSKQRLLNIDYLVLSIHLAAYINIQLYSFLTIREPPEMFTNNEEMMESGRTPYLKQSTKYFLNDQRYLDFANTSADCNSFIDCALKSFENNGITLVLQASFFHFQAATAVDGEARILRVTENMLTVYHEMLIRKDSPLVPKFQKVMTRLFEGGITERLYDEAIGILVMAKANTANTNMVTNSYSCQAGCSITFMQCAGVFYVWMFGCALSSVVFILELCIKREKSEGI